MIAVVSKDFPDTLVSIGDGLALQYFSNKPVRVFFLVITGFVLGIMAGTIAESILGIVDGHFSDWSILKVAGAIAGMMLGAILGKVVGGVVYLIIAKTLRITVITGALLGLGMGSIVTFLFSEITNDGITAGGIVGMFFGGVLGLTVGIIVGILRALNWVIQNSQVADNMWDGT